MINGYAATRRAAESVRYSMRLRQIIVTAHSNANFTANFTIKNRNWSLINVWPIIFLSLDLGPVYNFDLKIDDAIVFAIVANPYIAIFRPIGANSIFGQF